MTTAHRTEVDTDEGRYILRIWPDDGPRMDIDIHDVVLDFYASVQTEIRPYVLEAESARAAVAAGVSLEAYIGAPEADGPDYDLARDLARGK